LNAARSARGITQPEKRESDRAANGQPKPDPGRLGGKAPEVPFEAAKIVVTLSRQALDTHVRLREINRDLAVSLRGNDVVRRLMTIPGIGPVGATALAASVTDPHQFRSGRHRCLVRIDATSEVERWQRAARSHH
jgi:transposase